MSEFDEIRPYNDEEVSSVLTRLVYDNELVDSIIRFKFNAVLAKVGFLLRNVVRSRLRKQVKSIHSIADFQSLVEHYLVKAIDDTVTELTVSGLDRLDNKSAYLFISNHRDIAMDPALINISLYRAGFSTLRIAIGDNLLTKPFASDLMRLNKSFIVNRSAKGPREKLKAAKLLSKYIHCSVMNDGENVWIAQREGRAKDGKDRTNSAIINMLSMSKEKRQSFSEYVTEARIVPVSISYEFDPCDVDKTRELYLKALEGRYEKEEHEDVKSIAKGITGFKGRVHLAFGKPLFGDYENSDDVTKEIDKQIIANYKLQCTNVYAYELKEGKPYAEALASDTSMEEEKARFHDRLKQLPNEQRDIFLTAYANPIYSKIDAQ